MCLAALASVSGPGPMGHRGWPAVCDMLIIRAKSWTWPGCERYLELQRKSWRGGLRWALSFREKREFEMLGKRRLEEFYKQCERENANHPV